MRKRNLYQQGERSSSKIPTIIIMSVILFAILYYGKSMSEHVAKVFVPDEPKVDVQVQPADSQPDVQTGSQPDAHEDPSQETAQPHSQAGAFIYNSHKSVVAELLKILANPHAQADQNP